MAQSTTNNAPSPQLSLPDKEKVQAGLIGQPCGQHSSYTFYKAFSYLDRATQTKRVLMLGEFFFMKISPHDDPCIGELQLLWEDRQRNQLLSSTRLYFLPEQTPGGRQSHHGQHEVLAASEKVILRLTDLISWITYQVDWIAGLPYQWPLPELPSNTSPSSRADSVVDAGSAILPWSRQLFEHNQNVMPSNSAAFLTHQRFINDRCQISLNTIVVDEVSSCSPSSRGLDFSDVITEKLKANELTNDLSNVVVLSYTRYCRYRSFIKRIEGSGNELHHTAVVQKMLTEIGIPIKRINRVYVHFCRDTFEHEALLSHDLNCDHLAPRLKGRPRKRLAKYKSNVRASSPESMSSEDNSRTVQPRRSQRSVVASILTDSTFNYSETKNLRRTKQRPAFGNKVENVNKVNKSANKENKSDLCNNTCGSGNDTDNSSRSSSVDSNNNDSNAFTSHNVNLKLKEDCVGNELIFLQQLNKFMKERKTPIQRVPNLGFKKIDLYVFFTHASKFGGYNNITIKRFWKKLYDQMGGDKRSTSAATITRRHYERLLLPFERYLNGLPDNLQSKSKKSITGSASVTSITSKDGDDGDEDEEIDNYEMDEEHSNDTSEDEIKGTLKAQSDNKPIENLNHSITEDKPITNDPLFGENDQGDINKDSEELILKYSNSQINKIKQSRMSDSFEGEMLVELANDPNIFEADKNKLSDDVKLIASSNNETLKEDLFTNIIKGNIQLYDNEDVKIKLTAPDLPEQESKFIDKIGMRLNKIETESELTKLDSSVPDDSASVTIVPTTTFIHKSNKPINSSLKSGCFNAQNVLFKFSNPNYHNKMTALVHPTQRETKSDDIYDFDDSLSNEIDKGKGDINEILLLKPNKTTDVLDSNNKSIPTVSPTSLISTLVSKMHEIDLPQTNSTEKVVKESKLLVNFSSEPEKIQSVSQNLNVPNSFAYKAFSMPKPLESPNNILLSLKLKHHKDMTVKPLPAHYRGSRDEFFNKSLSSNLNSDFKGEVLDLSVKKRPLEISIEPQQQIASTTIHSTEGLLLDLSVTKKRLNSVDLKVNSKKHIVNKGTLQSKNNLFQNNIRNFGHNQRSTLNNQIESSKNTLLSQASSQIPSGINNYQRSKHLARTDFSRNPNKVQSTKQFQPNLVGVQARSSKSFSNVNGLASKQTNKQVVSSKLQHSHSHSALNRQRVLPQSLQSALLHDRISISEYNPSLPTFIGSPSLFPGWSSNSSLPISTPFSTTITSASNVHNTANAAALPPTLLAQMNFRDLLQQNGSVASNNALLGQEIIDQAKLLESYTSPLFIKSLLEQNQLAANARNYLALAQQLFAPSK